MDDSIDVDAVVPTLDVPAAAISTLRAAGEGRLEDLRLVQRAIRQHADPSKVAALAYGFDLAPAAVIGVCRANNTRPQHAMAVAIALRNGDAGSAYDDIIAAWPDVDGGWERHTHPSLRGATPIAVSADYDPTREILDRWTGRSAPTAAFPPSPMIPQ